MSALTITISSPGRAIVADGRLVAGESADVSVLGGVPAALYLVDASRDVVAACTSFVPGETSATGELNLATVPLAEIVAEVPAGRAIPLQAILEDAAGAVIGYGLLNVVSAPMPDALDPLDDDLIYAKLSDLQDYLTRAEADERYAPIDSATPIAPSTDPSAAGKPADAYQAGQQLAGKQATISDLAAIRSGAAAGATAVQSVNGFPPDASGDVQLSGDNIPIVPGGGSSVNESLQLLASGLRYALDAAPRDPDPETGKYALDDRTANWIQPAGASVTIVFPPPIRGRLRDFEVYVESLNMDTGNVSLTCDGYNSSDVIILGNGGGSVPDIPRGGDTVLYFSEVREGHFLLKGEEFVAITGGN